MLIVIHLDNVTKMFIALYSRTDASPGENWFPKTELQIPSKFFLIKKNREENKFL